ncbi:MAG: hypothetical protein WBI07_18630 [Mobilitalea sp.]
MKKKANIVFFSSCFMIAVILEAYCIQVFNGDLLSVIGIGVVVLITGYLLIDSISTKISSENQKIIYFVEHTLNEESDKWSERFSNQFNIQKATYAATKKNTVIATEQFASLLLRLETLEKSNARALQKIMELQKKSLEGQKKALNIEVNYNKNNTTQIIEFLKTQGEKLDRQEQLSIILDWMEKNNELLKENLTNQQNSAVDVKVYNNKEYTAQNTEVRNDLLEEDSSEVDFDFSSAGNFESTDTSKVFDLDSEAEKSEIVEPEAEEYLSGTVENAVMEKMNNSYNEMEDTEEIEDSKDTEEIEEIEETDINNAPEISEVDQDQSESEAVSEKSVEIEPLYADPNKALTADEIASLFASFGN